MRTVLVRNCDYATFARIMDSLITSKPWCLSGQYYSERLKVAVFHFTDSAYIPDELKGSILEPPSVPVMNEAFEKLKVEYGSVSR